MSLKIEQGKTQTYITVGASIATILSLLLSLVPFGKGKTLLTAEVLYREKLDVVGNDDSLNVQFTYKRKRVNYPWKIAFRIKNTGDKTIIGEGEGKTLLLDELNVYLTEGYQFLKVIQEKPCTATIRKVHLTEIEQLSLGFLQWRSGEICTFSATITGVSRGLKPPNLLTKSDEIKDGAFNVELLEDRKENDKPLIAKLPPSIRIVFTTFGYVTTVLSIAGAIFLLFIVWPDFIRKNSWQKKYKTEFNKFILKNKKLKKEEKALYMHNPRRAPTSIWAETTIPRHGDWDTLFESWNGGLLFTILIFAVITGVVGALLSLHYY